MIPKIFQYATQHWTRIRMMMERFGQKTPNKPTIPDEKTRILRARLIMEEALETVEALGVQVSATSDHADMCDLVIRFDELWFGINQVKPDLAEIADGCADISVVTIGTLVACGLPDDPLLRAVDNNNLDKVERGRIDEHGKFQKHPSHVPPDMGGIVQDVGMLLEGE